MPIKINLLAEEIAAEELRRRDPVKRVTWATGIVVGLVVLWCCWLQVRLIYAKGELRKRQADWAKLEQDFNQVSDKMKRIKDVQDKLAALQRLATNRFLWGPVLNALQHTVVPDVEIVRLRSDQTFALTPAVPAKTSGSTTIPAKPATATETDTLYLEARAFGVSPEQQVDKYRETITSFPYFSGNLRSVDGVKLIELSPVEDDPQEPKGRYVRFTIQCRYPEQTRTK